MAALNRPTNATYTIHESVTVDTTDREDHTFCGIMFPIKAKRSLPVHQIVINSLSIRGRLGPITVWVTKDEEAYRDEERKRLAIEEAAAASSSAAAAAAASKSSSDLTSSPVAKKSKYNLRARFSRKSSKSGQQQQRAVRPIEGQISMRKRDWIKIYEKEHGPSFRTYTQLDLSAHPIILRPGEVRGVYIHSTLEGDEAIVYDNKHQRLTHDDPFIQILTGRAHVSEKPFGKMPIWGWGNAWRDAREFVGQVSYGAVYRLWNPSEHLSFGSRFQRLAITLFGCQRRLESPMARLSDDIIFYILNMLKWDWAKDGVEELASEQRKLRKQRRRKEALLAATAAASVSSGVLANAKDDGEACCSSGANPTKGGEEEEDDQKPAAIVSFEVGSTSPRRKIFSEDEMRIDSSGDDEAFYEDEYNEDDDDEDEDSGDDSDEYDSDDYDDYRGIDPSVFHYRDYEEEDSDDEAAINEEQRLRDAEARRRSWMRSQFARIHVLNALASMNDGGTGGHVDMEVDSDDAVGGGGGGGQYAADYDSDYVDG